MYPNRYRVREDLRRTGELPRSANWLRRNRASSTAATRCSAMQKFLSGKAGSRRPLAASRVDAPPRGSAAAGSASRKRKAAADTPLAQTYIDLGQKSFARIVECPVCGLAYTHGEEADEALHKRHHRHAVQGVHIRGVLAQHIIGSERTDCTRLIALSEGDGAEARRKVIEAAALLDPELGAKDVSPAFRAVLCLEATGRVRAFVITEPLRRAYRVVPRETPIERDAAETGQGERQATMAEASIDVSSVLAHDGVPQEVMCGVSHVWVEPQYRRRGLARMLLDAARQRFAVGFELPLDQIAFSGPTANGRRLAAAYTGTERFLVYD